MSIASVASHDAAREREVRALLAYYGIDTFAASEVDRYEADATWRAERSYRKHATGWLATFAVALLLLLTNPHDIVQSLRLGTAHNGLDMAGVLIVVAMIASGFTGMLCLVAVGLSGLWNLVDYDEELVPAPLQGRADRVARLVPDGTLRIDLLDDDPLLFIEVAGVLICFAAWDAAGTAFNLAEVVKALPRLTWHSIFGFAA